MLLDEVKIKQLIGELILTIYNQNEQIANLSKRIQELTDASNVSNSNG